MECGDEAKRNHRFYRRKALSFKFAGAPESGDSAPLRRAHSIILLAEESFWVKLLVDARPEIDAHDADELSVESSAFFFT
jgi:hypothetical protein